MEPLPAAAIAGLTPRDVEIRFFDDRMERVPFDEPADLVRSKPTAFGRATRRASERCGV